jgi:hypothetical protein
MRGGGDPGEHPLSTGTNNATVNGVKTVGLSVSLLLAGLSWGCGLAPPQRQPAASPVAAPVQQPSDTTAEDGPVDLEIFDASLDRA